MTRLAALLATAARRCIPLTVHLELTNACNARCVHCFLGTAHARAPRELSADEWCSAVDQARALGALFISLSGGEAMLSPHFWTVAEHARRTHLALRVFTNGIALGREAVRRLAALRPSSVEVSVFSLSPERHDAVTGVPGSLSRAVRGLFRLQRAGISLSLKCPLLAGTAADHAAVRRLASRLGASVIFDPQVFPAPEGSPGSTHCRGDDGALRSLFADLAGPPPRPVAPDEAPCRIARSFVTISCVGDVFPCPVLRRPVGNIRETPLATLWRSPDLERLRARRFGNLAVCGTCPRSGYCGRCSALALLEDGDLDGPSRRACHVAELRERAWGVCAPPGAEDPITR